MKKYGLRELKKAQTKLDCINVGYELTKVCRFRELMVKDIISKVGITEMTFFNYFKNKDELLLYWMDIWKLDQIVIQINNPLNGKEAIKRIFFDSAQRVKEHPLMMMNIISYIVSLNQQPPQVTLEPALRHLLYTEFEEVINIDIIDIDEIILSHLKDMGVDNDKEMLRLLHTSFYGDALQAHMRGEDLVELYSTSLNNILG